MKINWLVVIVRMAFKIVPAFLVVTFIICMLMTSYDIVHHGAFCLYSLRKGFYS